MPKYKLSPEERAAEKEGKEVGTDTNRNWMPPLSLLPFTCQEGV